jgi:hypothetical protein
MTPNEKQFVPTPRASVVELDDILGWRSPVGCSFPRGFRHRALDRATIAHSFICHDASIPGRLGELAPIPGARSAGCH